MKKLFLVVISFLFVFGTAFADKQIVHTGYLKVLAPQNASVTAKGRSQYDLVFKELPHLFYRAWYQVSTNNSGAGSGEVTVTMQNGDICKFDIFYSNGWKAIVMGGQSNCKSSVSGSIIGLKAE